MVEVSAGVEPALRGLQPRALPLGDETLGQSGRDRTCALPVNSRGPFHLATLEEVPARGIEPRSAASKTAVLPLDDAGAVVLLRCLGQGIEPGDSPLMKVTIFFGPMPGEE